MSSETPGTRRQVLNAVAASAAALFPPEISRCRPNRKTPMSAYYYEDRDGGRIMFEETI